MLIIKFRLLILLCFCYITLAAQSITGVQQSSPIEISDYIINASFYTTDYDLRCNVDVIIKNLDQIDKNEIIFYLHPEFEIDSVLNSSHTKLDHSTELLITFWTTNRVIQKIIIKLPDKLKNNDTIQFFYKGWYSKTYMRSPSCSWIGIDKESVFLRSVRNSVWFPVLHFDPQADNDYANFELKIDVPNSMKVLAFGRNVSNMIVGERYISHWETDYRIPVTVPILWIEPDSNWVSMGNESLHIIYNRNSESELAAKKYQEICHRLIDFFNDRYGVGLASAPFYLAEVNVPMGGYASINTLGLSKNSFKDILYNYFSIAEWLGHEMIHQYVRTGYDVNTKGIPVIYDAFPLYFHIPALIDILGKDFEQYILERCWGSYIRGRETGIDSWGTKLPIEKPIAEITIEEYPEYKDRFLIIDKLILILYHLQKTILGDKIFYDAFKKYLMDFREKPAALNDFKRYLEIESGISLDVFFEKWLYSTEPLPEEWKKSEYNE